jgi:hypothetical protein
MSEARIFEELRSVEESVEQAKRKLESLTQYIESLKKDIVGRIAEQIEKARYTRFNPEALPDFLEEPYLIMPKRMEKGKAVEWYVIVPRFIDFQLGWLERSTKSYNVFIVNQYVQWFTEIPKELKERFQLKPLPVRVADGLLLTPEEVQEEAWNRYKKYLVRREGREAIRIKHGSEFQLIAQIIEDGSLPFIPRKVEASDLREPETDIQLRDYQEETWQKFLECGAIGVYWPFGTGKSFFGAYACAALKGRKLVIVPTLTLKEQWLEYLRKYTRISYEVQVETYHAFDKVKNNEYTLVIYDECQHLPANTFIRLATLKTKYRMGFSGSPYREDGRVNYIIALTGYPIGLAWEKFFELGLIRKPIVTLYVVPALKDKLRKLDELLAKEPGKTIIFCDSIELGQKIAKEHNLTFVFGETTRRLEKIRENEVVVVSRVGDEGMSIPEIDTLIEVDFLYGCYDEKTELLTSSGWKFIKDVTFEDEIATLNEDGFIEYHKPIALHKYPYSGKMLHFKGKCYDLLVTPNHEMYVRHHNQQNFRFIKAEDLAPPDQSDVYGPRNYMFKRDAKWRGIEPETIKVEGLGEVDTQIWLRFLGWYLSEGSASQNGKIKITQLKRENMEEIAQVFFDLPQVTPRFTSDSVYVYCRPLARYLRKLGHAPQKFIPKEIKQLSPKLLKILVETMLKGDGSHGNQYYTSSKRLADDLQEVLLKCGYSSTIGVRQRTEKLKIKGRTINPIYPEYCVSISMHHQPRISKPPNSVDYNGFVYDVTVPNHIIMVRRNGKAVWCSNSRMQESQRSGRLLHSAKEATNHYILMTEEELEKYGKRLLALYERGYRINIVRG